MKNIIIFILLCCAFLCSQVSYNSEFLPKNNTQMKQQNWSQLNFGPDSNISCIKIINNNDIFVSTKTGKLYCSENSGDEWSILFSDSSVHIRDIAFQNDRILLLSVYQGLLILENNKLDTVISDLALSSHIVMDSINNIYIDTFLGVKFSYDFGKTWQKDSTFVIHITHGLNIDNQENLYIWAQNDIMSDLGSGLYKSSNKAQSFQYVFFKYDYIGQPVFGNNGIGYVISYSDETLYSSISPHEEWFIINDNQLNANIRLELDQDDNLYGYGKIGLLKLDTLNNQWRKVNLEGVNDTTIKMIAIDKKNIFYIVTDEGCIYKNETITTRLIERNSNLTHYTLYQNYPNPFNPETTIKYNLPADKSVYQVKVKVYDALGQLITSLVNELQNPGIHTIKWNGKNTAGQTMPSGIYFCVVEASSFKTAQKMLLVR